MSFIYRRVNDPVLAKKVEYLQAEIAKQKATTDYIAMMADVEIPQEEEEHVVSEDQAVL